MLDAFAKIIAEAKEANRHLDGFNFVDGALSFNAVAECVGARALEISRQVESGMMTKVEGARCLNALAEAAVGIYLKVGGKIEVRTPEPGEYMGCRPSLN